ncbi:putative Glycosyltransferase involved in cell wall biogenesis [Vibrio nigripulchritudo SFn27]|uniref:Putative Glycosyltransferase involved in cell wall biogenesis n=1 Tax=Vibrio nigripulchritudo TaxID=28173 RepID=U4KA80_9VIBR|nr:glycosyltransferase [Vibrio nigripulchritudo]CCN80364.1 putative Glycosyltransferase involved in cell wall biogenesis [Vibrio nigripulchritudo BLFn1]CCN91288.1 putative Glycosyltransferase involved in cell wall biogenesis [Vibrio nigripulchritudo SFn27]CCN92627.1 putative Glycosyltransferase involved in cell wall biogenesis [Vibrio nigripulchritudo ENn2]CCO41031.1 putative Glycosyltransferase involved in cell wall biogenesis [Vibrio nigripulchritudo SFn135]CCO50576.1 putative Glycosyltransf
MKISLIVAVYKDYQALKLILDQASKQTYSDFEVVIAEDAENEAIPKLITKYPRINIVHCHQEDAGVRKMRSINNAIRASSGEYLIFIDGDCLPAPNFFECHAKMAKEGRILSGRRTNLGPKYSERIRDDKLDTTDLANNYLRHYLNVALDGKEGHAETGLYFDPNGWFFKTFFDKSKRSTSILGCHFSCFRKDIYYINGFDESYGQTALGDDTDIEWRFRAAGFELKSVKHATTVFHLYHEKRDRFIPEEASLYKTMLERKENKEYKAKLGLLQQPISNVD